jgi:hypothetical protein
MPFPGTCVNLHEIEGAIDATAGVNGTEEQRQVLPAGER